MAQSQKIVAFFMKTSFESAFIFILILCKVKSLKGFYWASSLFSNPSVSTDPVFNRNQFIHYQTLWSWRAARLSRRWPWRANPHERSAAWLAQDTIAGL